MLALIPAFPLLGFLLNAVFGNKRNALWSGVVASATIFLSFVVSLILFVKLSGLPAESRVLTQVLFSWIHLGTVSFDVGLRFDVLSSLFVLVVTGVGTLIHIYSIGYMATDATPGKYFAYLNLFCFSMLILVLGASLPITFFGWEGVGLCSYLLIGYGYEDDTKASAGKKAFIANRIGDFGFLLGMFLLFTVFGTLDFAALAASPAAVSSATVTAICLLFFLGCCGKSAQLPLHVWLPDAMAGPTPVSALIHAATMVTAGVYLVSRLFFLFKLSPTALAVVAGVGALTAVFGAMIAIVQKDIKKVLAYSTISQLGMMFLACGAGACAAGVFHVITHGFFKALLFLAAGAVIQAMHEEQDITKMGGLRSQMPKTFLVFAVGGLAISGVPPFSGFFSKDKILWQVLSFPGGSWWLAAIGFLTALLTAAYMIRLFSLVFMGKPRQEEFSVREVAPVMMVPLQVLAVLSVLSGFIGTPHRSWIERWLNPVLPVVQGTTVSVHLEWVLTLVTVVSVVAILYFGLRFFSGISKGARNQTYCSPIRRFLENKCYIDELYRWIIFGPVYGSAVALWKWFDVRVVDRTVLGVGRTSLWAGQAIRLVHNGWIQTYVLVLFIGVVLILGYFVYGVA